MESRPSCDVVSAMFVFGAQHCWGRAVARVIDRAGDEGYMCLEHTNEAREAGCHITALAR